MATETLWSLRIPETSRTTQRARATRS